MNEVVTTTVPAGHHWPGEPGQELADRSGGAGLSPFKGSTINPDAVQNDGDLAGNGNLCLLYAGFPGARYDYRDWVDKHGQKYDLPLMTRDAGRSNRGSPPAHLPRVEIVVDIDDKTCQCCQGELHRIAISA
ncbi:hypothetical protein V4R08_18080 (plasmid) [Nitrobacter sp. NHB1]|uniref:hypothetical protein n=1 Tax=Nitrobacter sp. NHB1 TaxID=3119830 RepID=UPI003000019E